MSNGTSGDVNNIDFTAKNPRQYKPYEKMSEVAEKLARRVYQAHGHIEFHDWVPLDAAELQLPLKVRKPTAEMVRYLEQVTSASGGDKPARHDRESIYAERIRQLADAPDEIRVPLQVMRIGDLGIATVPFETFAETGLESEEPQPL